MSSLFEFDRNDKQEHPVEEWIGWHVAVHGNLHAMKSGRPGKAFLHCRLGVINKKPALGGYLREAKLIVTPATIYIRQGEAMGHPSRLTVEIPTKGGIVVKGTAVPIEEA